MLRIPKEERRYLENLEDLVVLGPQDQHLPLNQVAVLDYDPVQAEMVGEIVGGKVGEVKVRGRANKIDRTRTIENSTLRGKSAHGDNVFVKFSERSPMWQLDLGA